VTAGGALLLLAVAVASAVLAPAGGPPSADASARPGLLTPPSLFGVAETGRWLGVRRGAWQPAPHRYAYRWLRCGTAGGNCVALRGRTSRFFKNGPGVLGQRVRVRVTACNAAGCRTALTAPSAVVHRPQPPTLRSGPTVRGRPAPGETLLATHGTWAGDTPLGIAYQWLRCTASGDGCTAVAGATGARYLIANADLGAALRVRVIAQNRAGERSARSPATAPVSVGSAQGLSSICGSLTGPPVAYRHVIVIVEENVSYSTVVGSNEAPAFNQLAGECGLATNFHNAAHWSRPNYMALTSGEAFPADPCSGTCSSSFPSIFSLASSRAYMEGMTSNCQKTSGDGYQRGHNPPTYYGDTQSSCPTISVPLGTTDAGNLHDGLANDTLPQFAFVVPSGCHDFAGEPVAGCPGGFAASDAWLAGWVDEIAASPAYQSGSTVVFVTFDEGSGGGHAGQDCSTNTSDPSCHIATLVISPFVPSGTRASALFNHYSVLRTTEELLGISPLLGHAGDAQTRSMRAAFGL
jgi:hypothetical protein